MLTIFTTPKPFRGHEDVIQQNAWRSWSLLEPKPEVLVLDAAEGAARVAGELGFRYLPDVARNEFGTPLIRSLFQQGQDNARFPVVCYVNSDVILLNDFMATVAEVAGSQREGEYLLVGRRWNVAIASPVCFDAPDWQSRLLRRLGEEGWRESPAAIEFFAFSRGRRWEFPDFAVGRGAWDGWLLHQARSKGLRVIDASMRITLIHQQHDYSHWREGDRYYVRSQEYRTNQRLRGSFRRQYTILDASHRLTAEGSLYPSTAGEHGRANLLRVQMYVADRLRAGGPYTAPVLGALKWMRRRITPAERRSGGSAHDRPRTYARTRNAPAKRKRF